VEQAIFAAGKFWGIQQYFDQVPGVSKTYVGYTGGTIENPKYDEVESQTTGHAESILIEFDAAKVAYETLVRHFFRIHDPTQRNRQGSYIGECFRSAIFYITDEQKAIAENVIKEMQSKYKDDIVTEIMDAGPFYRAESYHQKYTEKTGHGQCDTPYQLIELAK
jgi:methionine-S-sulfoxide reductase